MRQSGVSQTETIDELDRFKTQRKPATVRRRATEACGGSRLRREATHASGNALCIWKGSACGTRAKKCIAREMTRDLSGRAWLSREQKAIGDWLVAHQHRAAEPVVQPEAWKAFFQVAQIRCPRLATRAISMDFQRRPRVACRCRRKNDKVRVNSTLASDPRSLRAQAGERAD